MKDLFQILEEKPFINVHCHSRQSTLNKGVLELVNYTVNQITEREVDNYSSVGIHPWFIQNDWRSDLTKICEKGEVLAIGECGLDRICHTPFDLQIKVFEEQIQLAERLEKPLIVHCVRAVDEIIRLKQRSLVTQPWIFHGFRGRAVTARKLLESGCYISLGKLIMIPSEQRHSCLEAIPLTRLFLETDADSYSIESVYKNYAELMGLNEISLKEQIVSNFKQVFING
jgi:TatD DNase family protein